MKTLTSLALAAFVALAALPTAHADPSAAPPSEPERDDGESRRGCCSHHGGVCGCGGDTLRCCDGTDSPTCEC